MAKALSQVRTWHEACPAWVLYCEDGGTLHGYADVLRVPKLQYSLMPAAHTGATHWPLAVARPRRKATASVASPRGCMALRAPAHNNTWGAFVEARSYTAELCVAHPAFERLLPKHIPALPCLTVRGSPARRNRLPAANTLPLQRRAQTHGLCVLTRKVGKISSAD